MLLATSFLSLFGISIFLTFTNNSVFRGERLHSFSKYFQPGDDQYHFALDLVAETSDGRIVIVDHKSSGMSEYRGRKLAHHLRQLFLYAHLLKQCCGIQADAVAFNLFKENQWIELPWTQRQEDEAISWAAGMMAAMESLVCIYFQKLTPREQSIQQLLLQNLPARDIRTQLHLSPRRLNRLMREMDEVALMVLGQKETSGDYGCQHICSARSYCDEGGIS